MHPLKVMNVNQVSPNAVTGGCGNPWDDEAARPSFLRWDSPKVVVLKELEVIDAARRLYKAKAQFEKNGQWQEVKFFAPAALKTQVLKFASCPILFVKYLGRKMSTSKRMMHSFVVKGYTTASE